MSLDLDALDEKFRRMELPAGRALIAELRASRKVVEAAREWIEDWRGPKKRGGEPELNGEPAAAYRLVEALKELSLLNVKGDSE